MKDERKTKAQLADELADLRLQVADLSQREARAAEGKEALRESGQFLQAILDSIEDGITVRDRDFTLLQVNRWIEQMFAHEMPLVGKKCYRAFEQREEVCPWCPAIKAMETGNVFSQVVSVPVASGMTRWFELTAFPFRDAQGDIVGAIEHVKDITDRKRAEDRLRLLSSAVEQAAEGIGATDLQGNLLFVNEAFARMHGYAPDELTAKHLSVFHAPEQMPSVEEANRQTRETGEFSGELWHVRRDGSVFPTLMRNSLLRDGAGTPVGMIGTMRDITDRKRAEEALRKASEEKSLILSSVSEEVTYHDRDMGIVWANRAAGESAGLTPEQLLGRMCYEVWHGRKQICEGCPVQKAMDTGAPAETEITTPDGRAWHVHGYPVFGNGGKVIGAVEVVRDITERVCLEEELRQALKMEAVGQLAGGIAHDFSNLMTGILCHAALLKVENPSPDDVREAATLIEGAAQRATELTSQLLGFARRGTRHDVAVDLNATVETSVRLLSRSLDSRIRVATRFCDEQALVLGDPVQMDQVVLNLAMNARDAMPDGGEMTFITQTLDFHAEDCDRRPGAKPGRYVVLSVEDTGGGMSEATRGRVFEPFFTTKPPGKGTGMGLAMVYGIAKDHGGWVELESEPGRGTAFRVFIPAAEPAADAEAPRP